ncbi:AAA domain-containing protein [Haloprofundus salinisoli]|uniref:AAA domain-containing protein n=1 Tax=Haloprofundus salinisoli TaxID=2876193 RepID=UPI001CCD2C83|nr:AAA domain-containing protein [Haloprofundus salinisoli]
MNVRGQILAVDGPRTVETKYGERNVADLSVRPTGEDAEALLDGDESVTVTLWGKWTHTAEHAEAGMELLLTEAEPNEFQGEVSYTTGSDSYVVLEPGFLVNVTDIRSWVQCPRMYYLNKLSGVPLNYPVVKGTIVHEVFGDLLRGCDLDDAIADRVAEAGLQLGLLGRERTEVEDEVRRNAAAIEGWLAQGTLTDEDEWRSEYTLISPTFGVKGRADALRRGSPVELKTGKNLKRDPRFQDKIQAACYALLLEERGVPVDTGTLLYTKNTALDRSEETGDLSPAKDFSIGKGLLDFVVRTRNEIAAMEYHGDVPTGFEADAKCQYCFEQDTCMVVSGRLDQRSKAGQIGKPLPDDELNYFRRLYDAIEEERRETHEEYRKLWEQTAEERADDDRAVIGLEPLSRRELPSGRWELRARKTDDAVSKLREGDVALASDGDPVAGHAELCRIQTLGEEVVVTTDEPVDLCRLDVYPSDLSVDRMLTALHDALLKGDEKRKDVLFGRRVPQFRDGKTEYIGNNEAQNAAVNLAVNAEDCALVHGPPGTGKTYTIARTIRALVERGDRVLLTAFTNRAVDNALEALRDQGFEDIIRVGTENGVRGDMQDLRLVRGGDPNERAAELTQASVVAATTASCGSRILREQAFDVALVDEASQLTEPGTLAALNLAERFVLVGDHEQLPPVVRAENDLQQSLFERLIDTYPEASVMLDRQYRMAQRIQAFSSAEFYAGRLRPATGEVAAQRLSDLPGVDESALPEQLRGGVSFVDPSGRREGNANPVEADRVAEVVESFVAAGVDPDDIGVIAPFRAQVAELTKRLDVTVDTVDRFQGSSEEVIVVSFVATGELDGPLFEDYRRVNVALTRAKKSLVLVGDAEALESDAFYARMLDWAR